MTVTFKETNIFSGKTNKIAKNGSRYQWSSEIKHKEFIASPEKVTSATFQEAMKFSVLLGQCFGLNPVLGVSSRDASKLRFTHQSARCIYSYLSIIAQIITVCLCILKLFKNADNSLSANTAVVFFCSNCITSILFLRMAMKWPKLCRTIAKTESRDPVMDQKLVMKCNLSCIIILSCAVVEHILANVSTTLLAFECQSELVTPYEAFLLQSFPWIWNFLPFNKILGIIGQCISIQCTFNWNFADTFVICISWYLSSRLEQISNRVFEVRGKYMSSSFWRITREDYSRVTNLVKTVDDVVSGITFISFANNLFSICLQVLHSLEDDIKRPTSCVRKDNISSPMGGNEHIIYFVYSSVFLIGRFIAVALIAARVHTASRAPAQTLYDVPSPTYCDEVHRFLLQVNSDPTALTGLQFFDVKRGIILTIAGTIVTYELVLMQLAGITPGPKSN